MYQQQLGSLQALQEQEKEKQVCGCFKAMVA